MSSIYGPEIDAALTKMETEQAKATIKATIKATEFEAGLTLKFVSVEKQKSRFDGAAADASIVERGILEEGEEFLYVFTDTEGDTRKLYSTSFPFLIEMNKAEVNENDWLSIKRTGKAKETKYSVDVIPGPIAD